MCIYAQIQNDHEKKRKVKHTRCKSWHIDKGKTLNKRWVKEPAKEFYFQHVASIHFTFTRQKRRIIHDSKVKLSDYKMLLCPLQNFNIVEKTHTDKNFFLPKCCNFVLNLQNVLEHLSRWFSWQDFLRNCDWMCVSRELWCNAVIECLLLCF